jgi:ABC-type transport system involved in multi-copper enzyme maturation permease subunit
MFSKALFKQSVKANGVMWAIVTFLACFMLACVMCISGNGNVQDIAYGVTDTIVEHEIESSIKKSGLLMYSYATDGETAFDGYFVEELGTETEKTTAYYTSLATWVQELASESSTGVPAVKENIADMPAPTDSEDTAQTNLQALFTAWANDEPSSSDYDLTTSEGQQAYSDACTAWMDKMPGTSYVVTLSAEPAYAAAVERLSPYCLEKAQEVSPSATTESDIYQEIYYSVMVSINPGHKLDSFYTNYGKEGGLEVPEDYDVTSLVTHYVAGDAETYITSDERLDYVHDRGAVGSSCFFAYMFSNVMKGQMLEALSEYKITSERYETYGFDFAKVQDIAVKADVSFQSELDYEIAQIDAKYAAGEYATEEEYEAAKAEAEESLFSDISASFMSLLPQDVADALQDVAQMDVYSLIIGSIYFKMAGLLLPIIYVIMASNNLIATQVDTGSMAYVLSTGTKRSTVTFTQGVFLVSSIFAFCLCTMLTSFACLGTVSIPSSDISYGSLALMNLGEFMVLFAIAGFNFLTSCYFDRQNRSMAVGGGLSIFALVCTMLGLFGTEQMPSIVRFEALNYFNYASVITLFDVPSIIDGTTAFIWKFAILFALGLICFIAGSLIFKKKDLPL